MKRNKLHRIILLPVFVFLLMGSDVLANNNALAPQPSHPVLFLDKESGNKLRNAIRQSHRHIWNMVLPRAERLSRTNPPRYKTDTGEQLWQRPVGDNIAFLAFAGYMTENHDFFDAAVRWAEASCAYPTWGNDKLKGGYEHGLTYGHQLFGLALLYDYGQNYLDKRKLALIKETLINRTSRQYASYMVHDKAYLQNHTWINITGMLASALVLRGEHPDAEKWIALTQDVLAKTQQALSPDGASQEGVGYWGYGMEWLLIANNLSKTCLGNDYYNSPWWKNTSAYGYYMMIPRSSWTKQDNIINFADSPRYSWNGPEHLFRALAGLNKDGISQWYADQVAKYNDESHWLNIVWYDPTVKSQSATNLPLFRHFDNMDIAVSRNNWSGKESLLAVKCGAPLGKYVETIDPSLLKVSDVGHTHPDANHFVAFANGEYLFKNNGYVQRQTRFHSTLLIDGKGQWGEIRTYFKPYPLEPKRNARINKTWSTADIDYIEGDASHAYMDESGLKKFVRKFYFLKKYDAIIIFDDIEVDTPRKLTLQLFPENEMQQLSPTVISSQTKNNALRVENLTPASAMILTVMDINARHSKVSPTTPLIKTEAETSSLQQVTAISWSKPKAKPVEIKLTEEGGRLQAVVNGEKIDLQE